MGKNPKPHELRSRSKRLQLNLERCSKPKQILPEKHLFVTEGTKTEPYYLQGLVQHICAKFGEAANNQFLIIGEGDNTLNLLGRAEHYLGNESDRFQHVWILYDKDDFPACHFDNVVSRCKALNDRYQKEGRDLCFHAIWSNECFELWLLLHFHFFHSNLSRSDYFEKLNVLMEKNKMGAYEKDRKDIFKILYQALPTAVKNAKKLAAEHKGKTASQAAPCTTMYELMESLWPYL